MIEVVRAGLMDLVVDGVPRRALRFGLSEAGPADRPALRAANRRVGNPPDSAALELLVQGPVLRVLEPLRLCLWGGALRPVLDDQVLPWGEPFDAPAGSLVTFERGRPGLRAYLAVGGGLALPEVFGSRSADLPSLLPGLAGRPLRAGDMLTIGAAAASGPLAATPSPSPAPTAAAGIETRLRVLEGAQWPQTPAAIRRFLLGKAFRVTPQANRVGMVLEGEGAAPVWAAGDMVSEGTVLGSVQWTPGGRPVVLLVDRGSIGGYPKPLQVIAADAWRAAQLRPGERIRFVRVRRTEALSALRGL